MTIVPAPLPDPTPSDHQIETWLLDALAAHGPLAMFAICFASCLALPVPASVALITAGAITAAGGLSFWQLAVAGVLGAIAGDQLAYLIGRAGRGPLVRWLDGSETRREARLKAEDWTRRRGGPGILFSRWPISPIGPYVNFAAGAADYPWLRFFLWSAPGEVLWIGINLTAGRLFAGPILTLAMLTHEAAGLLLSVAALGLLLWGIRRISRKDHPPEE